jgi:hypothetical protein
MSIDNLFMPGSEFKPSVQDDLWNAAESSNSGVVDMKYVWDVYINNNLVIRSKTYPNPLNGKGFFNASEVVRNYMSLDYLNANSIAIENSYPAITGGISIDYTLSVGEDVSGVTSLNQISGTTTAYNWAPSIFKRQVEGEGLVLKDNKFVTNRVRAKAGLTDRNLFIPLHIDRGTYYDGVDLTVFTYGENNAQIASQTRTYNLSYNYVQLNISPVAINNEWANLIDSNVKFYKVRFRDHISPKPTIVEFYVDMVCNPKFESSQLHFINQYGMFDTARFDLVKRLSFNVEKKTYQRNDYKFREGGADVLYYDRGKFNESKINYGSKIDHSYKLTMNYPSDSDYQWLAELITSPLVYFEKDALLYPVSIKETNYEYSEHIFNGLKVFEVNIDLNQQRFGFRR